MFKALKVVGVLGLVLGVVVEGAYGWAATKTLVEIDKELINKYGLKLVPNHVDRNEEEYKPFTDFKPFTVSQIDDNEDKTEVA